MKSYHIYKVNMVDGRHYRGEIAYKDDKMLVLKVVHKPLEQKLRLFYHSIVSIEELGWERVSKHTGHARGKHWGGKED